MSDSGATLKPGGETFQLKEQIIEDPVTGLTLWIRKAGPEWTLTLIGDCLEFGNRDLNFSAEGELVGAGTGLCCPPKASWLKPLDEQSPSGEGINEYSPNSSPTGKP